MKRKLLLAALALAATLAAFAASEWVYFGPGNNLQYRTDERGNRIMDFSFAGYGAGGVRLPDAPAAKTLTPVPGGNTAQLQAAIDEVSTRTPEENGLRVAVVLKAGDYPLESTVTNRVIVVTEI